MLLLLLRAQEFLKKNILGQFSLKILLIESNTSKKQKKIQKSPKRIFNRVAFDFSKILMGSLFNVKISHLPREVEINATIKNKNTQLCSQVMNKPFIL